MCTCRWSTYYALAAGRCMDNNVHGSLFHRSCYATMFSWALHSWSCYGTVSSVELCTHGSCYATVCSLALCTHASCYAIVCSLELCIHASCYATVCSLELCTHGSCYPPLIVMLRCCLFSWILHSRVMLPYRMFSWTLHSWVMLRYRMFLWTLHSCVMLRYRMFSWTLTHGSCYTRYVLLNFPLMGHATLSYVLLNFALMRHATLSYVLLNFDSWVMLRSVCSLELSTHAFCYLTVCSLELCTHGSCYATVCSLEFCTHGSCYAPVRDTICVHVVLALKLTESRSSKVLGRTGGAALTKRRLKTCDDELISGWFENQKMVVSCRPNDCFRSTACEKEINDLKNKLAQILFGTTTSNMISNIPLIKKTRPSN